jgi:hypothetical protein
MWIIALEGVGDDAFRDNLSIFPSFPPVENVLFRPSLELQNGCSFSSKSRGWQSDGYRTRKNLDQSYKKSMNRSTWNNP